MRERKRSVILRWRKKKKIERLWKKERLGENERKKDWGKRREQWLGRKKENLRGGEDIIKECVVLKKERKNERV